jgi:hypothetical protein
MAAAGCVGWIIAIQLVDVAEELPRYRQNIQAKMEALRIPTKGPLGLAANSLREIAHDFSSLGAPSPEPAALAESETANCAGCSRASSARTDRATAGKWIGLPSRSGSARSSASGSDRTCPHLHGLHADQEIRLETSSFPAGWTRSDQHHDASARRRGATRQPIPVDADPGQCRLWSSVRIRSVP